MPKEPKSDYLASARANLIAPFNVTPAQYMQRVAAAQAQATIALAEQQARTADALETANLIAVYAMTAENCEALNHHAQATVEAWEALGKQVAARVGLTA